MSIKNASLSFILGIAISVVPDGSLVSRMEMRCGYDSPPVNLKVYHYKDGTNRIYGFTPSMITPYMLIEKDKTFFKNNLSKDGIDLIILGQPSNDEICGNAPYIQDI